MARSRYSDEELTLVDLLRVLGDFFKVFDLEK